ncbi:MAG: preprotein translocase subunit SecA [Bacteroidetes bacterium CG2_30_33_31]|nr:MAG: preprotein translocase subunit SecA [Bacteroidetes bacterium CG2_30_33_31]
MLSFISNLFGKKSDKDIKNILPILDEIKKAEVSINKLTNDELRAKTLEFKNIISERIKFEEDEISSMKEKVEENPEMDIQEKENIWNLIDKHEESIKAKIEIVLNELLPEAFAVMRVTARRFNENEVIEVTATEHDRNLASKHDNINIVGDKAHYSNSWEAGGNRIIWDMVHYDVQLIGGIVLHQGKIAEMATGEGKTLVATLPIYLNALPGRGVHLVTVNDYLARRDSQWMGMLMEFHGLRVDSIDNHEPHSDARRNAYLADITYGTNNEFGFDYLRDNMATEPSELVQRKHNFTIVDEVDSVLIDDARTPLIISGPTPKGDTQEFDDLKPYVDKLYNSQRQLINKILAEAKSLLANSENNKEKEKEGFALLFRAYRGLPKNKALIKFLSESGMKAGLQKTENFYMAEQSKNMHIIDDELFFVIEEKQNSIELTDKGIDMVTEMTGDPKFYILPDMGTVLADLEKSGLSHHEITDKKSELLRDYSIKTERVHTMHQLFKAYTLFERDVEYVVMDNKIKIVDEQTGRILDGRRYSDGLHQAIEAKENCKIEAATQTYATITLQNYFRMYNKLAGMTGTAETEAGELWDIYKLDVTVIPTNKPIIRDDREDLVYKTVREKYNAVIDEIEKLVNEGRPVLVGTTSVEISELLSRMLQRKRIKHNVLNAKLHQREADIVAEAGLAGNVTIATNMAGRGTDIKLGKGVIEKGGLAIIGTERHESRRVDRQLRGRAGRQGDPGSSQFYVSLEDNLMRIFGSERIAKIMDRMGLDDGEVIQHSMITKSIERAQRKVEENNFGIRKRLLEYDDVMNAQREVIYKKRRHALYGERLSLDVANMMYDLTENIVETNLNSGDFENFEIDLISNFAIEAPVTEAEFLQSKPEPLIDKIYHQSYSNYISKSEKIGRQTFPTIENVFKSHSSQYTNIAIPMTDGIKTMNIISNLEKANKSKGKSVMVDTEKIITLKFIDDAWKEQLREMDDLKQSVQNASYEQKDPLLIFKFESFELFKIMINRLNREITSFLVKCDLPENKEPQIQSSMQSAGMDFSKLKTGRSEVGSQSSKQDKFGHDTQEKQVTQPIRVEKKVGRNDPCPCGSGKKYKQCHGLND